MKNQLELNSFKNLKAELLFTKTNIVKAVLKLICVGFLLSLMSGIYVFADQLIMAKFIPTDGAHGFNQIFNKIGSDDQILDWLNQVNAAYGTTYKIVTSADIIKSSLALTNSITIIFNYVPLLIAIGASVLYAQALSLKNIDKAKEIYKTSFWCAIICGLFFSILFSIICDPILKATAGRQTNWSDIFNKGLTKYDRNIIQYFELVRQYQINWAIDFSRMMAIGSFFNVMMTYYMYMIRTEGRNLVVTIGAISCNVLNILMDFILIKFAKIGMASAGTATLIGWIANFFFYMFYIFCLTKKDATILNIKNVWFTTRIKFSFSLAIPIIILGLTAFSRNMSNAISSIFFMSNMNNVVDKMHIIGKNGQYFQQLSGVVLPINNLLFYAMFGICDGVRPLVAYCFSVNKIKRIKITLWMSISISFAYGLLVFGLFNTGLSPILIQLFNMTDQQEIKDATTYLIIQSLNISFVSLSIGGLTLFQATNNLFQSFIASIIQGSITFWIVLPIVNSLAIYTNNPFWLPALNPINNFLAGSIILIWSSIYCYHFLGKILIKINVNNNVKKFRVEIFNPKLSFARKQLLKNIVNN